MPSPSTWPAILILLVLSGTSETSYRRITTKDKIKKFYAEGGKNHLGKRVHIHIESSVLKKKAKRTRIPGGRIVLIFENRSVPIMINPRNLYYKTLKRKKKVTGLLCIKAAVIRPDWDLKGRCFLYVHKIKNHGGKLVK